MQWDAEERKYKSLSELRSYCARVASTVGVMMCVLMRVRDKDILARACDLGVAMQLTNIVRDIGEDARSSRIYIPTDWMKEKIKNSPEDASGACNDYLKVLGLVATGHAWLKVLEVSFKEYESNKDFYEDKIQTANFFFNRVLPRIESSYITATTGSNYIMNYKFN